MEVISHMQRIHRVLRGAQPFDNVPTDDELKFELQAGFTVLCRYESDGGRVDRLFVLTRPEDVKECWGYIGTHRFYRKMPTPSVPKERVGGPRRSRHGH